MNQSVYICIVSHHHDELIMDNIKDFPKKIGRYNIKLYIIDNVNSEKLENFSKYQSILYYADEETRGYGANINKVFSLCSPEDDDVFIVCNPDVILDPIQLRGILETFSQEQCDIKGVKVYLDKEFDRVSSSNRNYPCILDFFISFVFKKKLYHNSPDVYAHPDWISGGFMVIRPGSFRKLGGFDEKFFMYCEDIDICYRAKQMDMDIVYDPSLHIVHESRMASQNIFSTSFLYHLRSVFRYLVKHKITCLFSK